MSDLPKLGTKDPLAPNDTVNQQTGRNGLVTFYPFGTDQNMPAVISINGENGGIDIGGTREKDGKLLLRDKWRTITYIIDGETGTASQSGDIVLYDASGFERVRISGKTADVTLKNQSGDIIAHLDGKGGALTLGGMGEAGEVSVRNSAAKETIRLDGGTSDLFLGGNGQAGDISVRDTAGNETIRLNGSNADATFGGNGQGGDVIVRDTVGNETIRLDGSSADMTLGGGGQNGELEVNSAAGVAMIQLDGSVGDITSRGDVIVRTSTGNETIRLDGSTANLTLGGNGQAGDVIVRTGGASETVRLDGSTGDITSKGDVVLGPSGQTVRLDGSTANVILGGSGQAGIVSARTGAALETIRLDAGTADITLGGNGQHGDMFVRTATGTETIRLNGELGDIILSNADAAENFTLADAVHVTPGTLMVLDDEGKLQPASVPYDCQVVGVVAGAGNYRPGIVLDHKDVSTARVPISVLGKVSCKADATYGSIKVGDLLTTSTTEGHAMKASDRSRAFGAVIGKALSPLREGVGLVDVLITLQ